MKSKPMHLDSVLKQLDALRDARPEVAERSEVSLAPRGDSRDGAVYLLDNDLLLAVKVAMATGRSLLLTGDPGSGKSSVAAYLAKELGWRYYEHVVTSRTEASDLLWQFDTVRKLGDASGRTNLSDYDYVEPGALWWAFDRDGAGDRGGNSKAAPTDNKPVEPLSEINETRSEHHAVVLIDEIDKADPDVPNALLVPLGSNRFVVRETQTEVKLDPPVLPGAVTPAPAVLVIVSSNGERALPSAFVRRCITHRLAAPDPDRLVEIAVAHAAIEGYVSDKPELERIRDLAERTVALRGELEENKQKGAGAAEFLDAVRAARELKLKPEDKAKWDALLSLTVTKTAARS
jgi:MoxR-like ATPase